MIFEVKNIGKIRHADVKLDGITLNGERQESVLWRCFFFSDRKSTRLNSSHNNQSRMPSSA